MLDKEFHFGIGDKVTLTNKAINQILSRSVYKPLRHFRSKGYFVDSVKDDDEDDMTFENPYYLAPTIDDVWEVRGTWKKDSIVYCEIKNLRTGLQTYLSQEFMLLEQDLEGYA